MTCKAKISGVEKIEAVEKYLRRFAESFGLVGDYRRCLPPQDLYSSLG